MADDIVTRLRHIHMETDDLGVLAERAGAEIERLEFERDEHRDAARAYKAEIERLRSAGDALAASAKALPVNSFHETLPVVNCLHAWEEARRG